MFCQSNGCWRQTQSDGNNHNDNNNNSDCNEESSSLSSYFGWQQQHQQQQTHYAVTSMTKNTNTTTTTTESSIDENDVALAKEMNALSVQEREKILEDIHGVASVPEETPAFVAKCFQDFDISLSMIPKAKRRAYDRAIFLNPSLEEEEGDNNTTQKLMFLRAELYHARRAAQRLVKHYEEKLHYFGGGKLGKTRLTLEDLSEEDLKNLNYRGCVVLPQRDPSGRPIWFFDVPRFDFDNPDSTARCFWYITQATVIDDDMAQLKGICGVAYCPGDRLALPATMPKVLSLLKRSGEVDQGFPSRMSAFQICYNDTRVKYIASTIGMVLGKQVRLRIRTHFGSDQEMQYSLMTFGIKCDYLFRGGGGGGGSTSSTSSNSTTTTTTTTKKEEEIRRKIQQEYIQRRREIERIQEEKRIQEELQSGIIQCPQSNDVLVGRGRPYQDFPGNHRLLALVNKNYDRYRQISSAAVAGKNGGGGDQKQQKTLLFLEIIQEIHDSNGRFLEREKNSVAGWKVASEKVAREKTAGAFRFKTFQLANNNNKNSIGGGGGSSGGGGGVTAESSSSSPSGGSVVITGEQQEMENSRNAKRVRYGK